MKKLIVLSCLISLVVITGCAGPQMPPTTLKVSNISRKEAVRVLWENGGRRENNLLLQNKQIWKDPDEIDKPKAILKYELHHILFWSSTYGRDQVSIIEKEPNDIFMSLICEDKHEKFLELNLFNFYSRNHSRERNVMYNTAVELRKRNAKVQWVDDWPIYNYPLLKDIGNGLWMAFETNSPSQVNSFLKNKNYSLISSRRKNDWIYVRSFDKDRSSSSDSIFEDVFEKRAISVLESYERIIVKYITYTDSPFVVIGVAAKGTGTQRSWIFSHRIELGSRMKEQLLNDIAKMVLTNSEKTVFKDPTLWTEYIDLP